MLTSTSSRGKAIAAAAPDADAIPGSATGAELLRHMSAIRASLVSLETSVREHDGVIGDVVRDVQQNLSAMRSVPGALRDSTLSMENMSSSLSSLQAEIASIPAIDVAGLAQMQSEISLLVRRVPAALPSGPFPQRRGGFGSPHQSPVRSNNAPRPSGTQAPVPIVFMGPFGSDGDAMALLRAVLDEVPGSTSLVHVASVDKTDCDARHIRIHFTDVPRARAFVNFWTHNLPSSAADLGRTISARLAGASTDVAREQRRALLLGPQPRS